MKTGVGQRGFTLVEILAVLLIVLALGALILFTSGYVQGRAVRHRTQAELTALATALESYRGDFGHYPMTGTRRLSANNSVESDNNARLLRALMGQGRVYFNPPTRMIQVHSSTGLTNLFDDWEMPFVYYNSPGTTYSIINNSNNGGYTTGGQVNQTSYDLFSYGPDQLTYIQPFTIPTNVTIIASNAVPARCWADKGPTGRYEWKDSSASADDVVAGKH